MKKRLHILLMIVLTLTVLTTGCQSSTNSEYSSSSSVNMEPTSEFVIYRPPYTPDWLMEAIATFRQVYPDVKVTIEDFSTGGTYEELCKQYQDRINNEMMTGGGPDIIFPDDLSADRYKAMQSGIYLDLTPFFEQDKNFNEENFVPGVFNAGRYQGRQYIVPLNIYYPMFIARTPVLEQLGIVQVASEDTASFLRQTGEKSQQAQEELGFDRMMNHSRYFNYFLTWANLKLVDYENKQVCSEPEKVRSFMEAYKTYYKWDISEEGRRNITGTIAYGKFSGGAPTLPINFCYEPLFDNRINFNFMASSYLDVDGSYNDFFLRDMDGKVNTLYGDQVAVPITSKNQLNAYRFIQILLSDSIQKNTMYIKKSLYEYWLSPVNKEVMEVQIQDQMEIPKVDFYMDGKYIGFVKSVPTTDWLDHIEKLNSVNSSVMADNTMSQMVWESMEPFFKDEKGYEACFNEMQTKLKLYMDE